MIILILIPVIVLVALLIILLVRFLKAYHDEVKSGKRKKLNLLFKILCGFGWLVVLLILAGITGNSGNLEFSSEYTIPVILVLVLPGILTQCLYFLPYLIANSKGHLQENAIFVLNLLTGWTIFAWIIALIWALTNSKQPVAVPAKEESNEAKIEKLYALYQSGAITQEEFETKKKQLLEL